jgi:hypothetical protein
MRKHEVKLTMILKKPLAQVLLPLIPPLAQKLLQEKFIKKKLTVRNQSTGTSIRL